MQDPHEGKARDHGRVCSLQIVTPLMASCCVLDGDRGSLSGAANLAYFGVAKSNRSQTPDTDEMKLEYRGMNCGQWSLCERWFG
jgi:hypothetical protein